MNDHPSGEVHSVAAGPDHAGERLDRFLSLALPGALSRSRVKALIEAGQVSRDGATIREPSERVKPGRVYRLCLPPPEAAEPAAQAIPLSILYEDAALIVVDKPAGMVVHPAPGNPDRTLVNALIAHCGASLSGIGGVRRPGIVHRIDKDTSGIVVAAKTDAAHHYLSGLFARHDIERAYAALAWGVPSPLSGEFAGAIGRDPKNRKRMAVTARGKPARTFYKVERAFGTLACLLDCRLATGRTHQIRVHLAEAGHAILGDPLYGRMRKVAPELRVAIAGLDRQALHARLLGFRHPDGRALRFESPLPADLQGLIAALAHHTSAF